MGPIGETATARAARRSALLALALGALGCAREPADAWPPGAILVGRTAALGAFAAELARLEGTPLAREAGALAAALPDCEAFEAHAARASLDDLGLAMRCADPTGPLAAVHRDRGARDLALAWPLGEGRASGSANHSASGGLDLRVELPGEAFEGARALLRPGDAAPGPAVLGGADALVHARLRPEGGIDLPALLASGGQADQLFALRSALFGAAVLDGTWELALYLPAAGERVPRAALALGIRHQPVAAAAAASFLDEVEAAWPVRRTPFALGGASGACLPELRLLPGLTPCYVTTERALVVGWSEASLRKALDGSAAGLPAAGGLVAELARLPAADARIAAPELPAGAPVFPWERLVAEPLHAGDPVEVHLALASPGGPGNASSRSWRGSCSSRSRPAWSRCGGWATRSPRSRPARRPSARSGATSSPALRARSAPTRRGSSRPSAAAARSSPRAPAPSARRCSSACSRTRARANGRRLPSSRCT